MAAALLWEEDMTAARVKCSGSFHVIFVSAFCDVKEKLQQHGEVQHICLCELGTEAV